MTICAEQSDGNQRVGPSPELETLPRGSKSCRHPSRGASPAELREKCDLWLYGPAWLSSSGNPTLSSEAISVPEECLHEMKTKDRQKLSTCTVLATCGLSTIVRCETFSDVNRLLRVTAYVLKFVRALKTPCRSSTIPTLSSHVNCVLTTDDTEAALVYWLKASQSVLPQMEKFQMWKQQFGLFQDKHGVWRCGGQLANSVVASEARHPMFLDKNHHLTHLIIHNCHQRIMHSGVKGTLTELRSRYWVVGGRQLVKKLLHSCVTCRRFQAKPYRPPPAPPLPSFRVTESPPFLTVELTLLALFTCGIQ